LQWAKTLRDLVELRNATLANIKVHLLGRDETGAANEPADYWDSNPQIMFERAFKGFLMPWTLQDLKLKCEDCSVESEDVSHHEFPEIQDSHWKTLVNREAANLCPQCVEKREAARQQKAKEREGST
jgi:hypothetical protein